MSPLTAVALFFAAYSPARCANIKQRVVDRLSRRRALREPCTAHTHTHSCVIEDEYRSTSLMRNSLPQGPYGRPMSKALWWS